jgi:hypothetical protein
VGQRMKVSLIIFVITQFTLDWLLIVLMANIIPLFSWMRLAEGKESFRPIRRWGDPQKTRSPFGNGQEKSRIAQ